MATKGVYKLDDGNCYPTNCFPARSLLRPEYREGAGHWQVARQTAEKTKIEWLLAAKPSRVKWRTQPIPSGIRQHVLEKTLDRALLIKLHHVRSPSDLCSVDVSNQHLGLAKEDDFPQFTSVAYINATENLLSLEVFGKFPGLRQLDLSLNALRNLKVSPGDFPHLEILDLSYNNLSPEDVQALGVLPRLKALHLTANGLNYLPLDLAVSESGGTGCLKFPALEVLLLDDNHLSHSSVFVSLANLQSLKQLNLDRNGIKEVPYLHRVDSSHFSIHPLSAKSGIREGLRSRKSAEYRRHQEGSAGLKDQAEYIYVQNSKDPDRSGEILFRSCSPDLPSQANTPVSHGRPKTSCSASFSQEFIPPLPELRYLSLANNQIEHEEDLLAVALFPSLTELTFYGNPFTTSRSGDPPLLTSFLQKHLGIKLVRKKLAKPEKPRLFIPIKANRKVKSRLPKVQKHPLMLDPPLETTTWQLWTGAELGASPGMSLDQPGPLPPIRRSLSAEKGPQEPLAPVALLLEKDDISVLPSSSSSFSDGDLLASDSEMHSSSLDELLEPVLTATSSLDQLLSQSFPPLHSFLVDRSQVASFLMGAEWAEHLLPSQEERRSERAPPSIRTPSGEQGQLEEPPPPPALLLQEQHVSDLVPPAALTETEQEPSEALPPVGSLGQPKPRPPVPPPNSPSEEQNPSEAVSPSGPPMIYPPGRSPSAVQETPPPPGSPTVKQDPLETMIPISSPPQRLDVSQSILPTGSHTGELLKILSQASSPVAQQDQLELAPSRSSPSLLGGLMEPTSPMKSPVEEQDLFLLLPPIGSPPADQDQLDLIPPALGEEHLLQLVPPVGLPAGVQTLEESLLPSGEQGLSGTPPVERDPSPPGPFAASGFQEREQPVSSPSVRHEPMEAAIALPVVPSSEGQVRPPSTSSSRELHVLFNTIFQTAEAPSSGGSWESLVPEESESFFMTQVAEEAPPEEEETPLQKQSKWRDPDLVPDRYKGYEELLDGPTDPDFINPVGIQQNVQALEKALWNSLIYREPKARLDSVQKPFVPMAKKIFHLPPRLPQKTKAQQLEEILQKMRTPTNILEVPLACVLRKKKANWREYREAIALLKEFRQEYKATVASYNMADKARSMPKKCMVSDEKDRNHRTLSRVKWREQRLKEPSLQEDNDFSLMTERPS